MSSKSPRFADTSTDHADADEEHAGQHPALPAPRLPLADPTNANVIFFDVPLAYAYGHGIGSVTLTMHRQLVDTSGQVYEDTVITGLLRAPLTSLQTLKQVIAEIEKLAEKAAASAVVAAEAPAGRPH